MSTKFIQLLATQWLRRFSKSHKKNENLKFFIQFTWKHEKISSTSLRCLSPSEITSVSDLFTSHSQLAYACHNFKYLFSLSQRASTDKFSFLSFHRTSKHERSTTTSPRPSMSSHSGKAILSMSSNRTQMAWTAGGCARCVGEKVCVPEIVSECWTLKMAVDISLHRHSRRPAPWTTTWWAWACQRRHSRSLVKPRIWVKCTKTQRPLPQHRKASKGSDARGI